MAEQDPKTGRFLPGNSGNGGRHKGARNKLHADFIQALLDHFHMRGAAENAASLPRGQAAIEIVYRENPRDYLKLIASVLPKEYTIEDNRYDDVGDEELREIIDDFRRKASERERSQSAGEGASGAKPALN
ncbi:hypothetical protein [Bradyrhizobium ottawaense]|uniref:hypothetical protein n=1 Tax=Bradyrhizobium ottawaense TaxID=931866 RepID=UPI001BA70140|nr:hypothetical protein [Bradyrhizobium ottawaense]MBR1328828.1 hypothetical protein [Bradyrhizobium ottawaense]